jgi:hypothetical protein
MKQGKDENEVSEEDADEFGQENPTGKSQQHCTRDFVSRTLCTRLPPSFLKAILTFGFSDIGSLQKKLASLKDELLFWRRSDRVSRQCLKALLQVIQNAFPCHMKLSCACPSKILLITIRK